MSTKSRVQMRLRLRITAMTTTIHPHKKMERGMEKEHSRKKRRMVKRIMILGFLFEKQSLFVPFVEIMYMLKKHAELKKEQ
jgi:hypothetical protein